ncbi:MAG TPA: prolipoprotein diacylglyceryl transferase [Propionibacteriaceae bacterium]|nr:prolipoprotein diacylglyceryl transferase [Propionibacteriaceae bacterium]
MTVLFIPSPPVGVWYLGPLPIRAYALAIITGIVVAWWITGRRWRARGGTQETLDGILVWTVLAGIIGARIYHVATDPELYFGPGRTWYRMFFIWEGGLGIWGAVAVGAVVAWWRCRVAHVSFAALADVIAPGLLVAQAIGRIGNYFNQELYGRPTTLPWGLEIDPAHRMSGYEQYATYHPTFLYELLWCLAGAALLILVERLFHLGRGKLFASYIVWYTIGRFWVESLRIDTANTFGGLRLNEYTSLIVFAAGVVLLVVLLVTRPGPSPVPVERPSEKGPEPAQP